MTQQLVKCVTLVALFSLFFAGVAQAAVVAVGEWQLGEDDPGAVAGNPGNATSVAAVNSPTLDLTNRAGSPTYGSGAPAIASSLSMDFDPGEYYTTGGTVPTTATDNFGIEAWVNRDSFTGNQGIAWNGNAGWGLYSINNDLLGHLNGAGDVGTGGATVLTGEWFHVALVRDSGTATLYLNGTPNGSTHLGTPSMPTGSFHVGQIGGAPAGFESDGKIDHVRVFEFTAGQFDPATDLMVTPPAPQPPVTVGEWQLGEDDPGAVDGGSATTGTFGVAAVGTNLNLANTGSVNSQTYTSDTPGSLSSLATTFDDNDGYFSTTFSAAVDNFGIEAWAKFDNAADPVGWITLNGLGGTGWGIVQVGSQVLGHYPGVGNIGSASITPGAWTHLALVRDGGTATFYVNGVAAGSTSTATPNPPNGVLEIGYLHSGVDKEHFNGAIDHVRVFQFDPGQFDPARDLTTSLVPEPGSLALLGCGLAGIIAFGFSGRRKRS